MKPTQKTPKEENNWDWALRNSIAIVITVLVVGVTVFIAIYMLVYNHTAGTDNKFDMSFIGQTLLPLWGTWLGTVLAFYFGKANFESASKSYQEAIKSVTPDEKIAKLLVKDVMLPVNKIEMLDYDTEKNVVIKDILNYKRFKDYNRFSVFDKFKVVKYMIHRSTFFEYMYDNSLLPADKTIKDPVLDNLLTSTDDKFKNVLTRGFGFVCVEATVLDAKKVIDSIDECKDVFITQTGKPTEPVLGLLTNTMIFEKAKI